MIDNALSQSPADFEAVSYTHLDVYKRQESPLSLTSDFILSLCELIVGGKDGLQPVQDVYKRQGLHRTAVLYAVQNRQSRKISLAGALKEGSV